MQIRSRVIANRGVLCLVALATIASTSAIALQPKASTPVAISAQEPAPPPGQQQEEASKSVTLTGTIVKNDSGFVLRDATGTIYHLDAQDKAEPFEGKSVKVTGKLEASNKMLRVDAIEVISA